MADEATLAPANNIENVNQESPTTNLMSPSGDLVSVSNDQLDAALHPVNGYRVATPEDIHAYQSEQKYGTPGQQLQTAAEGAVSTATFGAIPGFGKAEDIRGRQEENPISSIAGSIAPFAAEQLLPGVGQAADASLLAKTARLATTVPRAIGEAGEAITQASGLTGVGAKALQYAAENAIMQGSNEVSKALLKDPDSSVHNAVVNEGMAALLGGALGAAAGGIGKTADLWESKYGSKASDAIIDKTIPDVASQELQSGIEIPATMKDALSGNQDSYNKFQVLQKSDSHFGKRLQSDIDNVYNQAQDKTLETLGVDPRAIEKAPDAYQVGTQLKDALTEGIKAGQDIYGPIYDKLKAQYKGIPVSADQKAAFVAKLTQALSESGIGALEGSAEKSTMANLFKSLDNIKDAEGIKNLNTGLNNAAKNMELQRLAAVAGPIIKDFESGVVQSHLGATDPSGALLGQRKAADAAYKDAMTTMSDIKQAVGVGRFKGTNGFLRALDEKPPEQLLQRLSAKNRQDVITMLEQKFPKVAEILKNFHINDQLHDTRLPDGRLNVRKFLNNMLDGDHNPQHIQDLVSDHNPAILNRLGAIKDILNAIPKDGNPSNSAAMLDRLWKGKLGTIAGGVLGVGGHGHIAGGMLGAASEKILNEIKPFLSYKILEMRGAGQNIVPSNVKALFDYAKSVAQGHLAVNKAVNSVFNANQGIKPPSSTDTKKLDKYIAEIRKDPTQLQNIAKNLQDNLSDHASSAGLIAANAANYLNGIKPRTPIGLPMDSKLPPNKAQETEYHRQLVIAQQPLMALQHIKDGTLTPKDMITLQNCHPVLYQQLKTKLLTQATNPEVTIPYKTRLSMALFVGQPLDSTMTPMSIISAQPVPEQQQPQGGVPGTQAKRSTTALNKLPGMYKTSGQARDERMNKD